MTTDKPTMRVINIALDYEELPCEITVIASAPICDRINGYFGERLKADNITLAADEPDVLPIITAGAIAKHYGRLASPDAVVDEIWNCLTGVVFNRFWDNGLDEYWGDES